MLYDKEINCHKRKLLPTTYGSYLQEDYNLNHLISNIHEEFYLVNNKLCTTAEVISNIHKVHVVMQINTEAELRCLFANHPDCI